uniref:Uncharacterized protein n=1 Tax=Ditylenchus dipsaci TaxID=166011 RepID=A0A915CY60_9BILA
MAAGMMPLKELDMFTLQAPVFAGTPQQNPFFVKIKLSQFSDLVLIDVDADLNQMWKFLPQKHLFNSSASTTFVDKQKAYVGSGKSAYAYIGSDIVNLGKFGTNISFAILKQLPSEMLYYPIDGMLGLSWNNTANNISVFQQIADQLDSPVISVWLNRDFIYSNGTGEVTIGEEDTENCKNDWQHVSEKLTDRQMSNAQSDTLYSSNDYFVYVNTVAYLKDNISVIEKVGKPLKIACENEQRGRVSLSVMNALTNATNALYNSSIDSYVCDCDLTNFENVSLFIGGESPQKNKTIEVTVRPEDYVFYVTITVLDIAPHFVTLVATTIGNATMLHVFVARTAKISDSDKDK